MMIKNMTVTQIREMFGRLPNPYEWEENKGFDTPYKICVNEALKIIPSAYDKPCKTEVPIVTFRLVETVYGLDWQIA